jgi:hypothetical protein
VVPATPAQLCRHRRPRFRAGDGCSRVLRLILSVRVKRKEPLPGGKRLLDVGTLGESVLRRRGHPQCELLGDPTDLYLAHGDARPHGGACALRTPDRLIRDRVLRRHDLISIRDPDPTPGRSDAKFMSVSHAHPRRRTHASSVDAHAAWGGRPLDGPVADQAGESAKRALSSGLTTLPVGLRGSASMKTNCRGTL